MNNGYNIAQINIEERINLTLRMGVILFIRVINTDFVQVTCKCSTGGARYGLNNYKIFYFEEKGNNESVSNVNI